MMTKALVGAGARKVFILGRRREVLEKAAKAYTSIVPVVCDIGVKASLQSAVDYVAHEVGYVNLLVVNAGIHGPEAGYNPAASVPELRRALFDGANIEREFTEALHVNVTGSFFTMLAFIELLDAGNKLASRGGGFGAPSTSGRGAEGGAGGDIPPSVQSQVVFTSSVGAYNRHWSSTPAYAGSKAAVAHLAKQAATNLVPYGIRVNAVAPGGESAHSSLQVVEDSHTWPQYSLPR